MIIFRTCSSIILGNHTLGVSFGANLANVISLLFTSSPPFVASLPVMIYGVVKKGEATFTFGASEVAYYLKAEDLILLGNSVPYPPRQAVVVKP